MSARDFQELTFERILISRQHNQMGDMLLAVPALRAIKETYPGAEVGIVTSTLNRDVLANNPYVDHLFTYDKRDSASHLRLLRRIRREHFDLAIALHTVSFSFTTLMLAVLSGARYRVGSTSHEVGDSLTGSYLNLTLPLPNEDELARMNEAEHNLYPLRAIGIDTGDLSPLIVPSDESERWAQEFAGSAWRDGTVKLAVHPGAGKAENIWPAERFARVVDLISESRPVSLAVAQGPPDEAAVTTLRRHCGVEATVLRGRRIADVAAVFKRADLVICNDTGVMHVSAAVGANTLAVFGPTDPSRWAPRSPNLDVVQSRDGRLLSLTPEAVAERALATLAARTA
jgi:heptosyltransferase-2